MCRNDPLLPRHLGQFHLVSLGVVAADDEVAESTTPSSRPNCRNSLRARMENSSAPSTAATTARISGAGRRRCLAGSAVADRPRRRRARVASFPSRSPARRRVDLARINRPLAIALGGRKGGGRVEPLSPSTAPSLGFGVAEKPEGFSSDRPVDRFLQQPTGVVQGVFQHQGRGSRPTVASDAVRNRPVPKQSSAAKPALGPATPGRTVRCRTMGRRGVRSERDRRPSGQVWWLPESCGVVPLCSRRP